jgi:hypothetical protein
MPGAASSPSDRHAGYDAILSGYRAHHESDWFLYAPTCALVEADRVRPGTAEHTALPVVATTDTGRWRHQRIRILDLNP